MTTLAKDKNLNSTLGETTIVLLRDIANIPDHRKKLLHELTTFVQERVDKGLPVYLNFICTHNSRRSHISQIWAQTAAYLFGVQNVFCFSGGTEATAFNPRAVKAMKDAGFDITPIRDGANPVYEVRYAAGAPAIKVFSKKYDDPFNHQADFAAVMTCSDADENCPLIVGASARIPLTYNDPKAFDGTPLETEKYRERVLEIGREILYAFSTVRVL